MTPVELVLTVCVAILIIFTFVSAADRTKLRVEKTTLELEIKQKFREIEKEAEKLAKDIKEKNTTICELKQDLDKSISTIDKLKESEQDIKLKLSSIAYTLDEVTITTNEKIFTLESQLQDVIEKNKDLSKELEFYTEIEADSKELNEDEFIVDHSSPDGVSSRGDVSLLDPEQLKVFEIMQRTNKNIFITGKAGTGKSFLLRTFSKNSVKRTLVLAPTGIAAFNIDGSTLHSVFGYNNLKSLDISKIKKDTLMLKSEKRLVLQAVKTIIIDEISMVRSDTLEKIDKILKVLNDNDEPFGGKQMIFFGDVFQLPPIASREEIKYLKDLYGGIYFFNAPSYSNGGFEFAELTVNHRQKDDAPFFDMLNKIREGKFSDSELELLHSRLNFDERKLKRIIRILPTKLQVEETNSATLKKIHAKLYTYNAKVLFSKENMNSSIESIFPITEELKLKLGALVMMVTNDPNKRWVNGTLGIVSELTNEYIKVKISGYEYEIHKEEFTQSEPIYEGGTIKYDTTLQVEQYPLVLAYAITIHKSQGMTYKNIACDISNCFECGQAYVALSRCSSLSGLHLLNRVDKTILNVDEEVKNFYLDKVAEKAKKEETNADI